MKLLMKLYDIEEFITLCRCAVIMEKDGIGWLANEDYYSTIEVLPLEAAQEDFDRQGFTHVSWYPK